MKVYREIEMEVDRLQIGDRIYAPLAGETHTATAIQEEEDGMLFLLDEYLNEPCAMNVSGGARGGYEKSDLRKYLQLEIIPQLPIEFINMLVPFENGDLLRLLSKCELFGDPEHPGGQIEWMEDRRHRLSIRNGCRNEYGWTQTPVAEGRFAYVGSDGGCNSDFAFRPYGVRPAFKIAQPPESEQEPMENIQLEPDPVNNPAHYTAGRKIQPIDVIEDWNLNFHRGNALKYISRAGRKFEKAPDREAVEDLQKAIWYLEREIKRIRSSEPQDAEEKVCDNDDNDDIDYYLTEECENKHALRRAHKCLKCGKCGRAFKNGDLVDEGGTHLAEHDEYY